MVNRKVLLCLLLAVLTVNFIECRFGSRGSSRGSSSRGSSSRGWGGSHGSISHSNNKPSWSSGSSSSHQYPSSSSGLSGSSGSGSYGSYYPSSSSGLSGSSGSGSYSSYHPSSSSGLSGSSGSFKPSYPYSNSGLSGSGSSSYPSSSSGLSGSGSRNTYYPPSQTGLSGSGTSNGWGSGTSNGWGSGTSNGLGSGTNNGWGSGANNGRGSGINNGWGSGNSIYPPSSNPMSGSGSNSGYPSSGGSGFSSGKNYYPSSSSGTNVHSYPSSTYPRANNDNNVHHTLHNTHYNPPTYYSAPQHLYVTEYRNSGSRYSDLLTGLTLYNLGRSHSHYSDHYYSDDYYNRRYNSGNQMYNPYRTYSTPQETATCRLKIKDHNRVETVKIPCEIVSTFKEDSKIVTEKNTTVCVTKTITVNDTSPSNNATSVDMNSNVSNVALLVQPLTMNNTMKSNVNNLVNNTVNGTIAPSSTVDSANITSTPSVNITAATEILPTVNNASLPIVKNAFTFNETLPVIPEGHKSTETRATFKTKVVNVTTCTTATNTTDPLKVQGPAVDPSGKECIVEIQTKDSMFHNKIDCSTLLKYAKMPEPKKDDSSLLVMPSRGTLKSWKSNPPWWMSMFIAV